MVSLFFSHHDEVVSLSPFFFLGFLIAHEYDHSLGSLLTYEVLCWAIILLPYTPPRKPASGLVLCIGVDCIDGNQSFRDIAPLSPLLAAAAHLSKYFQDHYTTTPRWYCHKVGTPSEFGVHLVVAIDGQVVAHAAPAWRQRHTPNPLFRTDKSIGSGRQFRKCSCLHRAIAASPQAVDTAPSRRCQDPTVFHWQFQWLWISCWLLYFEVSPSILLTDECDRSFGLLIFF